MFPSPICQICGSALRDARARLMGVCLRAECQLGLARRLQVARQVEAEIQKQKRQRLAETLLKQEAARLGLERPENNLPVVVPANLRRLVKLPARRKRAFRSLFQESLRRAAAEIVSHADGHDGDASQDPRSPTPPALEAMLRRGCAACRGRCCQYGGDHAYQNVDALAAYLRRRPELRPRQVLAAYLSRLPNRSYEDSCIYHTETGCALPRDMLAPTCETFYCEALRGLLERFAAGTAKEVIFFAMEGTRLVRGEPSHPAVADQY
jgi:hypothetical protein